jgi:DNA polymerase-3 subunit chi
MEVSFYHLERQALEEALPRLLTRVLQGGHKALVLADTTERVRHLNDRLWTFDPGSFLPHGTADDDNAADQPILLATDEANPSGADILVVVDGAVPGSVESYSRCLDLFNGLSDDAVAAARERWKIYREKGYAVTYWRQDENGRWEKKA